ncbi:LysR family transcriptional regulator [Gottfriedia acidiceleris]|uniref:LysR family transcriptional regulator n=1 Tax=Gottfriedia acidiceleris TaxID=371036 RepID=A0ABY4JFA1_9BACI|nr:LysR family transcriptional regulator [Gottfriedia acidiceleris]UPM52513.1 LysR family transcriptional regulator [Gottfriedia acidiceleris]
MIDFEWYRSFISIYKQRSVSKAAESRIMTQPAMSQHLAALEAEIGEALFIRAPRKMIPTEKGKELYTKLIPYIENLERMSLEITYSNMETEIPVVRIGAPGEYFSKQLLEKLTKLNIRFTVQFDVTLNLLEMLQNDQLDLVIATQKLDLPGIKYEKLEEEKFVLVAPYNMLPIKDELNIEKVLTSLDWISYGLELPIIRRYWKKYFSKRPGLQPKYVIPDLRTILQSIQLGMGVSLLPTYLLEDSLNLKKVKVLLPETYITNQISLVYKMKDQDNPLYNELFSLIKGNY